MAQLDSLFIQGFKSIRELELPLTNMNLLIGANGSGKSNFLELFNLLRAIMKLSLPGFNNTDIKKYVLDYGVASDFLYKGDIDIKAIKVSLNFGTITYTLELSPTRDDLLCIAAEKLSRASTGVLYQGSSPDGVTPGLVEYKDNNTFGGAAASVYESIQNWQVFGRAGTARLSPMKSFQSVYDTGFLRPDGSNIASYLFFLKEHPTYNYYYSQIVGAVRIILPLFENFILEANSQDLVRLLWKQKGSDYPMKPQALSDGTLRFICLATALLQPRHPDLIIIDGPELGLHPTAITLLAELMQARSTDTRLIVATQSPVLISCFEAEDLLLCACNQGVSTFTRLSSDSLDVWLQEYSLGQLWEKGVLSIYG